MDQRRLPPLRLQAACAEADLDGAAPISTKAMAVLAILVIETLGQECIICNVCINISVYNIKRLLSAHIRNEHLHLTSATFRSRRILQEMMHVARAGLCKTSCVETSGVDTKGCNRCQRSERLCPSIARNKPNNWSAKAAEGSALGRANTYLIGATDISSGMLSFGAQSALPCLLDTWPISVRSRI